MLTHKFTRSIVTHSIIYFTILLHISLSYCQKTAVFIIGTGRCGSSCTAGFLQIMGLDLGDKLRGEKHYNKKGCFEDLGTITLTNSIMRDFNARFLKPCFINWHTHPQHEKYKCMIKDYLHKEFGNKPLFGIKNGIISLFLPLYCEAAQELGYNPLVIVVERDKAAIINSWIKSNFLRNSKQAEKAISTYMYAIEFYTPAYSTLHIPFNDVVHNPKQTAHIFSSFIPGLKTYAEVQEVLDDFLDINLKHF